MNQSNNSETEGLSKLIPDNDNENIRINSAKLESSINYSDNNNDDYRSIRGYTSEEETNRKIKDEQEEENEFPKEIEYLDFFKKLSVIAFPTMVFYLCVILMQTINLIFVRIKYDSKEIGQSIGASNLYMNCTLFAIVMGLQSGIDTLCSNAYAVKKYYLMGLYLHRARIITHFICFVIVIIHIFTAKYVINLFDLEEKVKSDAIEYLYYSLIYAFFDVQSGANLRYLNVVRKAHVSFIILLVCILFHPLWNYIFLMRLDLGIKGCALSFITGRFLLCLITTWYLWVYPPQPEASFWINKKCFIGLWDYMKFTFGSAVLMCAEWWPFEILTYMTTYISDLDYNVNIYVEQLSALFFSLSVGISFAVTVYISDYIAKYTVKMTKRISYLSTIYTLILGGILSIIVLLLRGSILKLFTTDQDILEKGEPTMLVLSFVVFFKNLQYTFSSILRGLGKQTEASIISIIIFYLVMLTLAYIFGNELKMGVLGIWVAILIGNILASFLFFIMLTFIINWEKVQKETLLRLKNDNKISLLEIN
jgi:MATE family multidrug resistance protein